MEDWRAKALEYLPDLAEIIRAEEGGPVGLWIELLFQMSLAYEQQPIDEDLIGRIYDYAGWSFNQPSTGDAHTDPSSAAAVSLVEEIPTHPRIAEDLHRWMSIESFEGFEPLFRYLISDEEYRKFRDEFMRKKKEFTGPSRF